MIDASGRRTAVISFVLLYVGFCISYIDRAGMSLALGQVSKEMALEPTQVGAVLSAFFLGYAIMQVPGGWLADRFGSKYVVVVTILMWSVFTMATSLAWSLASLLAIRLVFGLAEGGFPSASIKAIAESFTGPARPRMSTLLTSSNYVGSMLAPLVMAPLIIGIGWRHGFEVIGFAGVVFAVLYVLFVPNVRPPARTMAGSQGQVPMRDLLGNRLLWQLLVVWFGLSCVNKGLDSWMPLYLLQVRHLDLKTVGVLTPIPFVLAALSTAMGGWVMTRFFDGRERILLIGSTLLSGLFLFLMYRADTVTGVIVFQSLLYFFKSFVLATVVALPTKVLADNQIGTGIGMINMGGQAAGFVAPLLMGLLVDFAGTYQAAFSFLLAMTLMSAAVAVTVDTRRVLPAGQPA